MDQIETETSEQTEPSDVQTQLDSLRHFVLSVLILVIVISGTLNIYLLYQYKSAGKELQTFGQQFVTFRNSYYKGDGPAIERFVRECMEFGKTHPDFGPVLDKYGLRPPPGMAVPMPAPAAASAPVKK
jgi:hypothetical protein